MQVKAHKSEYGNKVRPLMIKTQKSHMRKDYCTWSVWAIANVSRVEIINFRNDDRWMESWKERQTRKRRDDRSSRRTTLWTMGEDDQSSTDGGMVERMDTYGYTRTLTDGKDDLGVSRFSRCC